MSEHAGGPSHDAWLQATVAQRTGTGWTAITDAGVEIVVPDSAVTGFRSLRPGQRLLLRLDHPDADTAGGAQPLPAG